MKYVPLTLAGVHAILVIVVFGSAMVSPQRNGLAPILILFLDFPVSLIFEWLRKGLPYDWGYTAGLLIDCSIYLVGGSLWFYGIGALLRKAVRAFR